MAGQKICLLSLDGGGIRGLSELFVLKELMTMINPSSPPEPYECFDMIGGSSTGGLLAIMLGRLKMGVDDCIKAYLDLFESVFAKPRYHFRLFPPKIRSRFDNRKLQEAVQRIVVMSGLSGEASLKDEEAECRVSYVPLLDAFDNKQDVKIWEAVVGTMASPTYFDPIAIGPYGLKFVDGGIGANNPIRILLQEAKRNWTEETLEDKLGCIVSVGSGILSVTRFGETPTYFRFNVHHGLEGVGLDEWGQRSIVYEATANYLKTEANRAGLLACGELLGASRIWPWSNIKDLDENYLPKSAGDAFATSASVSDSGYSSGSSYFKSDLEHAKAEEDIFNVFTKDSELEPLYPVAVREIGSARFQKNLVLLLMRYCGRLRIVAHTELETATVKFMRSQVRPMAVRITNHFKMNEQSHELAPLLVKSQAQSSRVIMVQNYLSPNSTDSVEEERQNLAQEDKDDEEEDGEAEEDEGPLESPNEGEFGYARDFLISGEPFNSLRKDFWRFVVQKAEVSKSSMLGSELPSKVYVQNALEPWFPSKFHQRHRLKINIYWEVLNYLQKELDEEILRKNDRLISLNVHNAVSAQNLRERAELIVNGTPEEIISIVHQIAWIGLVFRLPIPGELSHSDFTLRQSSLLQFDLTYSPARTVSRSSDICWYPLFTGLILACGFPIPPRENEVGVELPFDVMTSLGGVMHSILSDGGYILRGFSSIFYPVSQPSMKSPPGSIQWHALHTSNKIPLESLRNLSRLKLLDLNEFEALSSCRTFLGYSSEVHVRLGTQDSDYGQSLQPHGSSLGAQRSRLVFSGLSANISGSHYIGAGLGANWLVNKSKAAEIRKASEVSYEAILSEIVDQPSVIYDVKDCRGWLVPTICVILQMIHVRALYWAKQEVIPTLENPIPFSINSNEDTASEAALQAITKDFKDPKLYVSFRGQKAVHLSAWVTELWAAIDAMRYDIVNDKPLKRAGLVGWDFFNVAARGTACGERKETRRKFQGNWKDLINESGIVVFHGIGFGEIIKAKTPICSVWNSIPAGEDLLVACIESVIQLQDLVGSSFASVSDFKMCFNGPLEWPKEASFSCDAGIHKRCFRHVHTLRRSGELHLIEGSKYNRGAVVFGDDTERIHPCGGLIDPPELPPKQVADTMPPAETPMTGIAEGATLPNGNPPEQAQQVWQDINIYLAEIVPAAGPGEPKAQPRRSDKLKYLMFGILVMLSAFIHGQILRRVA
ncbi:hypothetical protein MMC18_006358 [Xylographa bjoerkii]|nr:hypothetical protein [Xylographa bjoerkii]